MSIAAKSLAVLMFISSIEDYPAYDAKKHAPYAPLGSQAYEDNLRNYSKEMMMAGYTAQVCKEYYPKIRRNEAYFNYWMPPLYKDPEDHKKQITAYVNAALDQMNDKIITLGKDKFCKLSIQFLKENSAAHGPSILLD